MRLLTYTCGAARGSVRSPYACGCAEFAVFAAVVFAEAQLGFDCLQVAVVPQSYRALTCDHESVLPGRQVPYERRMNDIGISKEQMNGGYASACGGLWRPSASISFDIDRPS